MKVTPLSKALGAEITELDLRKPLDDAAMKAIRDAFDQHIFVVFREQELSEDDQLRAAGYFGKVHIRRKPVTTRDPGGAVRHAVHAGHQHRRERQIHRRVRRRRDVVPPRHQLLPGAAPGDLALFDEAAVLGRQHLLLQHVQGL